jgi:hypothetical protein
MTFINCSQLPESVFRPNFPEKHFYETKPNFPLTEKCFPLINFSKGKQTQKSLESDFPETTFQKTNASLILVPISQTLFFLQPLIMHLLKKHAQHNLCSFISCYWYLFKH